MDDRAFQRVVEWTLPSTTLLVAVVLGVIYGVQLVVLTLAAGALVLIIWLIWSSVQALAGESELSFEEAFSMGAHSAEEEQKRAVLRALKDLEYERSVGKISAEDYQEYVTRYRAEAKHLIRSMDESMDEARKQVERDLAKLIAKREAPSTALTKQAAGGGKDDPSGPAHAAPAPEPTKSAVRVCKGCDIENELDARFCKGCGAPMSTPTEQLCRACPARYPSSDSSCPECGTQQGATP